MRRICVSKGMAESTVIRWMATNEEFARKCAQAREMQADVMDDKILDCADACTPETAHADKVKISAYQWRAEKLKPKKYGNKLDLEVSGDINVNVVAYAKRDDPASV